MPVPFGRHRSALVEHGSAGQPRLARRRAYSSAGDRVHGWRMCDETRYLLCLGYPRHPALAHPCVGDASP